MIYRKLIEVEEELKMATNTKKEIKKAVEHLGRNMRSLIHNSKIIENIGNKTEPENVSTLARQLASGTNPQTDALLKLTDDKLEKQNLTINKLSEQ